MPDLPTKSAVIYFPVVALAAILALIAWLGSTIQTDTRSITWIQILVLMTLFAVLVGRGITGYWRGVLIDRRNKMSLSRLQLLVWTLLILSAIVTAVFANITHLGGDTGSPLEIEIPSQLWTLMGISTAAAVGSTAVLGSAEHKKVDTATRNSVAKRMIAKNSVHVDVTNESVVIKNIDPNDARWGDMLKGDEVGNAESVDVGKLQMFFFTFILVIGYGAAISAIFGASGLITKLPPVQDGMNVLLGISHTGYLATKAITQTPTQ